jgi:Holliday junction resolvase
MRQLKSISQEIREQVLTRSGHRCAICGRASDLEIAHLVPLSEGGDSSVDNLLALCRSCHFALDSNPTTSIDELRGQRSAAYGFEQLVVEVFHRLGFGVLSGATGPDAGVDIVARRPDPVSGGSTLYIIECKSSRRPLTREQIERFAAKASQYRAASGILITDAQLTPAAAEAARSRAVKVFNIAELDQLAADLEA